MAVSFQLDEEKTAYTGVNFDQEDYRYHYETITFRQRLANTASRLIYSRGYFAIYLICLILNVLLLAYGIKHISMFRKRGLIQVEAWYITIDILVSILLVLEISIRIIASPSAFLNSPLNLVDAGVLFISLVVLFFYKADPEFLLAENVILILRYTAQVFRTYLIIKHQIHQHQHTYALENSEVHFDSSDLENE